tara:strand:- start:252 stop:665 length:414 start_codon:yes stop_codon:yes gene_type:complete
MESKEHMRDKGIKDEKSHLLEIMEDIPECIHCKKRLSKEKQWIIVNIDGQNIYGCSYHCGIQLNKYIGNGYWKNVVNKEDFNEPRPVPFKTVKKDITTGFGMDEIRGEIIKEELRIKSIEESIEYDEQSDEYSDEEF